MSSALDNRLDLGVERLKHTVEFILRPNAWLAHPDVYALQWSSPRRWDPANNSGIPRKQGVYAFSVIPAASGCPPGEYVLYVGMAERQTLAARYRDYAREARGDAGSREHIYNMFKRWSDHMWYRYAVTASGQTSQAEKALRIALEPPMNRDFSADLNGAARAFNRL